MQKKNSQKATCDCEEKLRKLKNEVQQATSLETRNRIRDGSWKDLQYHMFTTCEIRNTPNHYYPTVFPTSPLLVCDSCRNCSGPLDSGLRKLSSTALDKKLGACIETCNKCPIHTSIDTDRRLRKLSTTQDQLQQLSSGCKFCSDFNVLSRRLTKKIKDTTTTAKIKEIFELISDGEQSCKNCRQLSSVRVQSNLRQIELNRQQAESRRVELL
mgnify:CR=1 FL=1